MKRVLLYVIGSIVVGVVVYYLTQGRGVFLKKPAPERQELGMTIEEFGKQYASLEGRFREQEEFIQRATGKKLHWVVVFKRPIREPEGIMISFGSRTNPFPDPVSVGELSITAKDRVYALRSGDVIKIDGILKAYAPSSLVVEIWDFELVPQPAEKKSTN